MAADKNVGEPPFCCWQGDVAATGASNRTAVHRRSYPQPWEPTSTTYKRRPRARPDPQATSGHLPSALIASNRRREAVCLVSGQFGRRHAPVPYIASKASLRRLLAMGALGR